jgi:8-amino-7-oxononanoate synthase
MSAPGMSLYAAGPTPATAAATLTAIELVQDQPERLRQLRQLFGELVAKTGLDTGPAEGTPIVPVMLGSSRAAMSAPVQLAEHGINANPILIRQYPRQRRGSGSSCAASTPPEQIRHTVDVITAVTDPA